MDLRTVGQRKGVVNVTYSVSENWPYIVTDQCCCLHVSGGSTAGS